MNERRFLSRVVVYGNCMTCGNECVGDSTREIVSNDERKGYAHAGECERLALIVGDKPNLTLRERLVLAHERGDTHNSAACPTCKHGDFMYRLGQRAAVREIAEGA